MRYKRKAESLPSFWYFLERDPCVAAIKSIEYNISFPTSDLQKKKKKTTKESMPLGHQSLIFENA